MVIGRIPLGFKKPDDRELINRVDDHISDNAQKAQDFFAQVLPDIAALKTLGGLAPGDVSDAVVATLVGNLPSPGSLP